MKHIWKVSTKPAGRYSSFQKWGWPTAEYEDGRVCASIYSEDSYSPKAARGEREHAPLKVHVADYSITPTEQEPCTWKWRRLNREFKTVGEAKAALARVLAKYPQMVPQEKSDES